MPSTKQPHTQMLREAKAAILAGQSDAWFHRWLCHPYGEACSDGCEYRAFPARAFVYTTALADLEAERGNLVLV